MCWPTRSFLLLIVIVAPLHSAQALTTEQVYARSADSVFTVEVHTGNAEARSSLGSGYLVGTNGEVMTNYHVVSSYIADPKSYKIRLKNRKGTFSATLVSFDVINDLALLKANGIGSKPLTLARSSPKNIGTTIMALGNPRGLRLSIIDGIFNGKASKGLIDRSLLSMPLNEGMSGGPIVNGLGEVVGTNVSIYWLSNSISFGVPLDKIHALLKKPHVGSTLEEFRQELHKQLIELEAATTAGILSKRDKKKENIMVGNAIVNPLSPLFDCWDDSKRYEIQKIRYSSYSCNLQFSPKVEGIDEVGSIVIYIAHISSQRDRFGFYGYLTKHGSAVHIHSGGRVDRTEITPYQCTTDRVRFNNMVWKMNSCVSALVHFPGLYKYSLSATSVSHPHQAIDVALDMNGFKPQSFNTISRNFLMGLRLMETP